MAYFPEQNSWESTRWLGGFEQVALGYTRELSSSRETLIGDLRVDAVTTACQQSRPHQTRATEGLTLALFPGSRWIHLKASLGPFLKVCEQLKERHPKLEIILAASPFIDAQNLAQAAANPIDLGLAYSRAHLHRDHLISENNTAIEVLWAKPYEAMARCDLALSLPGTNTAELAIANKATVVPLSYRVPVGGGGLLGIVDRLPGLTLVQDQLRRRKKQQLKFVALPNQIAGRSIVPELMVQDNLENLVELLSSLLQNPSRRREIADQSREVMGPVGASEKLLQLIESTV